MRSGALALIITGALGTLVGAVSMAFGSPYWYIEGLLVGIWMMLGIILDEVAR